MKIQWIRQWRPVVQALHAHKRTHCLFLLVYITLYEIQRIIEAFYSYLWPLCKCINKMHASVRQNMDSAVYLLNICVCVRARVCIIDALELLYSVCKYDYSLCMYSVCIFVRMQCIFLILPYNASIYFNAEVANIFKYNHCSHFICKVLLLGLKPKRFNNAEMLLLLLSRFRSHL